jgi:phage FluMu protein Com
MYRCPHCGDLSVSAATQFSPPFDGRTKCPTCKVELKVKMKLSNFVLALYLFARALLGIVFGFHPNIEPFWEFSILLALFFIQVRFIEYAEVNKAPDH